MSQMPRQNDATMDDIMASIRRIVGEEKARIQPVEPAPPIRGFSNEKISAANDYRAPLAAAPLSRSRILELTDAVQPVDTIDNTRALDPRGSVSDIDFKPLQHDFSSPSPNDYNRQQTLSALQGNDTLLSSNANAAVMASFDQLTKSFASQTATMEQMIREMLQPMLKNWLDDNLPPMVERLIKAEIERVARGGR